MAWTRLESALSRCAAGEGGLLLVSGESGAGKTRLVTEVLDSWHGRFVLESAIPGGGAYSPVLEVIEAISGRLGLGTKDPPLLTPSSDSLAEPGMAVSPILQALLQRLREVAAAGPAVLVLEDLQRAGAAAIELLPSLAGLVERLPLLVIGIYDSQGLPRTHLIRSMRAELRRTGRLAEIVASPLSRSETEQLLEGLLGGQVSEELVTAVHERTGGLPLFVAELATALAEAGALTAVPGGGLRLAESGGVPLPDSVVDAVLARTQALRRACPEAVEIASVLGTRVPLTALATLARADDVDQLLEAGLLQEEGPAHAVFHHALVRDAIYRTIPWARRRQHHRRVAEVLTGVGALPEVVAEHWLAAGDVDLARPLLLVAAERNCSVHAYRDAAALARRALDIWPEGLDPDGRVSTLEKLASCAELSGELESAVELWDEVAHLHQASDQPERLAQAHRRLANAADLLGLLARGAAAREAAAVAFLAADRPADAAAERLTLSHQLASAGQLSRALDLALLAGRDAQAAKRTDLRARSLALEGSARSALGEGQRGVELARKGLDLALAGQLTEAAGLSYYELATSLLFSTDYAASADVYAAASEFCREHAASELEQACLACMSVAVRFQGDWDRALVICGDVLDDPASPEEIRMVAIEESGLITALRGDHRRARGPLGRAHAFGRTHHVFGVEVGAAWGLAVVADLEGDSEGALTRVSALIDRCAEVADWNFALPALRWAATYLGLQGEGETLARCHRVLGTAATQNTSAKTLAVLAHVGGELLLADERPTQAASQFGRAVELMEGVESPYERALTRLRWGVAAAASEDREHAVEAVTGAYRTARQLGARPLARQCATALADLGEQVDRRLGRLAARSLVPGGLTRRETEVLRLLATGRTNRQIAQDLFVSPRTIDMHVRNLLAKLGCTSRMAAARRAGELGLVELTPQA